ncbi:MAG: hypothetical protein K5685_12295 [Bacteroidales bacterium]|nr:hypothetical protein [Bacteroidales bacterium]
MALEVQFIIAGSTLNQSGFSSIAQYGNYTEDDINALDSWRLTENPSFRIKHTPNFISYALRETRFLASDGNRQNRMTIEIRIAANKILANNVSPYTLLKDMYTELTEHYAEKTPDGKLRFKPSVNDMDAVTAHFREIIKKYPVEDRRGSYIKMKTGDNITGFVCLVDEQKEMFFRDTQYPEFANYSQIEIGKECAGLVHSELQNLEIPREIRFEVYEGNKSTGKILTNPSTKCTISKRATEEKEYTPCEFSLQELFEAHGGILHKDGATIEIDYIKSRINCRLAEKDIMYTVSVVYDGNAQENAKNLFKSGRKKMFFNDDDLSFLAANGGTKEYPASKVLQWDRPTLEPGITDGFKFNVFPTKDQFDKTFKIRINVSKQEKPKTTSFPAAGASTKKASLGYNDDDAQPDISDSEPIEGNGFNLKSALIGLGIGLLLGCGIMTLLYYAIPLKSDPAPRAELLKIATKQDCDFEAKDLLLKLKGEDKKVKVFFVYDTNGDKEKEGKIEEIKSEITAKSGWVDLYLASLKIDSVLKAEPKKEETQATVVKNEKPNQDGQENQKDAGNPTDKKVFELMPKIRNGLRKSEFSKCPDWSDIYKTDFKKAFDLFDGTTDYKQFNGVNTTQKLKTKAEKACKEKIVEGINNLIAKINEDDWNRDNTTNYLNNFKQSNYYKYVVYYDKVSMIDNFFNYKKNTWNVLSSYNNKFEDLSEIENASNGKQKIKK